MHSNDFETIPWEIVNTKTTLKHLTLDWFRYLNMPEDINLNSERLEKFMLAIEGLREQ